MKTNNRDYNLPDRGQPNWNQPLNENFEMIDSDIQSIVDRDYEFVEQVRSGEEVLESDQSLTVASEFKVEGSFDVKGDLKVV